jgi:hypothetical protein
MTVFAETLDRLFLDPNLASDALWRVGGAGDGIAVRVIRKSPDRIVGFGDSRAVMPSILVDVRTAEVALPAAGDTVEIAGSVFDIIADPTADTLRLVWSCEASLRP